jgi:hypothetical protein
MKAHRYFCVVVGVVDGKGELAPGSFKFTDWHLYRLRSRSSSKNPSIKWTAWRRIF